MAVVAVASCGKSRLFAFYPSDAALGDRPVVVPVDASIDLVGSDVVDTEASADASPDPDVPTVIVCPLSTLIGYATLGGTAAAPATTGGKGGVTITVDNLSDLMLNAAQPQPIVIRISGSIEAQAPVPVMSDKTIEGVGLGDGLVGGGLDLKDSHNIIIRNLSIGLVIKPNDAIHLDMSKNIWIDHCDLYSNLTAKGTYDGLVDIAHASDFVTVSWNKFHDHYLTSLVGTMASSAGTDTGHLTVTYHHNLFHSAQSYDPRVRSGSVHVFNNLYEGNTDYDQGPAIVSTVNAQVLVEGNTFSNIKVPISTRFTSEDLMTDGTVWDTTAFPNVYNNGSGMNDITMLKPWPIPPPYAYSPDLPGDAENLVRHCAGQIP
jgi:pectate lyase